MDFIGTDVAVHKCVLSFDVHSNLLKTLRGCHKLR
jgi:hypothetical protein